MYKRGGDAIAASLDGIMILKQWTIMKRLVCLLLSCAPIWLYAQDIVPADTLNNQQDMDSLSIDALTVEADTLPSDVLEALLAHIADCNSPQQAPVRRAGSTPLLTGKTVKDENGNITQSETYDYDSNDRKIRTTTEYYDAEGTHQASSSITEYAYNGNTQVMNTAYMWANNQWEGNTRRETVYNDNNKQITIANYSWNPNYNYWTPTATTTYEYDSKLRVPEQWTWAIDNTTKKLIPATRTQQEWDAKNNLILKTVYKGGQDANGNWLGGSGGTKNIYEFQDYGSANKKVLDEAYTWNDDRLELHRRDGIKPV